MDQADRDTEFSDYVAARWARLVRSAVLLGCTQAEAEDVVQTALTKCLVSWSKVSRAGDRDAYVHRVLINTFTSARRRHWTREQPTARVPDLALDDEAAAYDEVDAVQRALGRLTPDQRTAVVLRYYAHLSEQQMAAALRVAPGTVKSRLSRALALLADDPTLSDPRGAR